jgi:2,3-bisphosphoglycerate-independent phosphoglycerate mutase
MITFKQLILVVLDGFGVASPSEGNAIYVANPRNFNYMVDHFPATTLQASGPSVGLPWGERGNSEVGHLNLGAGRIVSQDLPRISRSISDGSFFKNPSFLAATAHVKKNNSKLHLVGLVSDGGVHSSLEHIDALLALASQEHLERVFVHMITDGRDTLPKAALSSLDRLSRKFLEYKVGKIATVIGRFFAMDRAKHWEVTEQAYKAMVLGEAAGATSARQAIEENYERQIYDETIPPTAIMEPGGLPVGRVEEGDAVIFFNFRPDRMVQLTSALADPAFDKFSKKYPFLQNLYVVTMTEYQKNLPVSVAFPKIEIKNCLTEILSGHHLKQFHIAESEKYSHVTSFFNGGRQEPWPLEEREIITSPQHYQKRYQDVPEMRVADIAQEVVAKMKGGTDFILANFANADMVGHTGNRDASIRAVQSIDEALLMVLQAVLQAGEVCLAVTADHGNIESVFDTRTGMVDTEHTVNPVPFIIAGNGLARKTPRSKGYLELPPIVPEGVLSDVAPTILDLMGLPIPKDMTAVSLLPLLLQQIQ